MGRQNVLSNIAFCIIFGKLSGFVLQQFQNRLLSNQTNALQCSGKTPSQRHKHANIQPEKECEEKRSINLSHMLLFPTRLHSQYSFWWKTFRNISIFWYDVSKVENHEYKSHEQSCSFRSYPPYLPQLFYLLNKNFHLFHFDITWYIRILFNFTSFNTLSIETKWNKNMCSVQIIWNGWKSSYQLHNTWEQQNATLKHNVSFEAKFVDWNIMCLCV